MVRLVFRPYTQVRRTICTSVSLRTSTRVSPGFILLKHSSPSFGSLQICSGSYNYLSRPDLPVALRPPSIPDSPSFRERVSHPITRIHVRLLGPCFKTGE